MKEINSLEKLNYYQIRKLEYFFFLHKKLNYAYWLKVKARYLMEVSSIPAAEFLVSKKINLGIFQDWY